MKLKLKRKPLLEAVQRCSSLVNKRTPTPITSHILMRMDLSPDPETPDSQPLQLVATDMETFLYVTIGDHLAYVEQGEFDDGYSLKWAIPGAQLGKLLSSLHVSSLHGNEEGDEVEIEFSGEAKTATITSDAVKGQFKLDIMAGSEFPKPNFGDQQGAGKGQGQSFSFNNDDGVIKRVLARNTGNAERASANVMCNSEAVLFFPLNGSLAVANTDGYVGAYEALSFEEESVTIDQNSSGFAISVGGAKIVDGLEGDIKFRSRGNFIECFPVEETGGISVVLRKLSVNTTHLIGSFQNIDRVTSKYHNRVAVNKRDILNAVSRVLLCSPDINGALSMGIDSFKITVFHEDDPRTREVLDDIDTGLEDNLKNEGSDANLKFKFNPAYLKRILAELGDDLELSFEVQDDVQGCLIQNVCIKDYDNESFRGFLAGIF